MKLPPLNSPTKKIEPVLNDAGLPRLSTVIETPKRLWKRIVLGGFISVLLMFLLCMVFYQPVLSAIGELLVYESDLTPCEILVVLSGGGSTRLERAIELYQADYAPQILITLPETIKGDIAYRDLINTEKKMCEGLLKLNEIPSDRVFWSDSSTYSTYAEALFLHEWMTRNHCRSAIVVAGYFQSRRARWSIDRVFGENRSSVQIVPAREDLYPVERWWTHEEGVIAVENEYIKNAYYRLKGLFGRP